MSDIENWMVLGREPELMTDEEEAQMEEENAERIDAWIAGQVKEANPETAEYLICDNDPVRDTLAELIYGLLSDKGVSPDVLLKLRETVREEAEDFAKFKLKID